MSRVWSAASFCNWDRKAHQIWGAHRERVAGICDSVNKWTFSSSPKRVQPWNYIHEWNKTEQSFNQHTPHVNLYHWVLFLCCKFLVSFGILSSLSLLCSFWRLFWYVPMSVAAKVKVAHHILGHRASLAKNRLSTCLGLLVWCWGGVLVQTNFFVLL